MCGIVGMINCNQAPVDTEVLKAMSHSVRHRGPDDEGYLGLKGRSEVVLDRDPDNVSGGWIGFGHRRLSIIDLSDAGKQPMSNPEKTIWITYNGEIYNHLEIRSQLEALGYKYHNPTEQTSCTAWNYYASATSNALAQASVAMRNFGQAYQDGYFPMIHCGTSYGHYKEVRQELVESPELRHKTKKIMKTLGKELVIPEEIVHYSEWVHAVRNEIAKKKVYDLDDITISIHPACHYHKLVTEDAIYDADLYNGQRTAVISGLVNALGAKLGDYSTWQDCCGFGFRHILVQRDFSRSFATLRKIEVMKEEANPDVVLTHDTGCVTTLDKSQFSPQVHDRKVGLPVLSDAQFAALAMGAHPYRVVQIHWHATDYRPLLTKMGIDWEEKWKEFQEDMRLIKDGEIESLVLEDYGNL